MGAIVADTPLTVIVKIKCDNDTFINEHVVSTPWGMMKVVMVLTNMCTLLN